MAFSLFRWLRSLFRPQVPVPAAVPVTTPPSSPGVRAIAVWVTAPSGSTVEGVTVSLASHPDTLVTNADGYACFLTVPDTLIQTTVHGVKEGYQNMAVPLVLRAGNGDYPVQITPVALPRSRRRGIVRADGRQFVDDTGTFFPLGATLFWAPRGWKYERERVQRNIQYLADAGVDYIRILCQVDWQGLENDPAWPDYDQILRELVAWTYDVAGIRTQLTIFGGVCPNPTEVVARIATVATSRPEAIHAIEVANEWYARSYSEQQLIQWAIYLRQHTPHLVTVSDGGEVGGRLEGDQIRAWRDLGAATWGTAHFDRDDSKTDWKWRHVRKPWESRTPPVPCDSNEPGGPRSSVAEYSEAIHLVWARAVGILCGWHGYLIHNGNGIYGVNQPARQRTPNVWEIPDIESTMRRIRALESYLPVWGSNGTPTRKGLGDHPLTAVDLWVDGARDGVVRDYAITRGNEFWQTLIGIKNYADVIAKRDYTLTLIDPMDGWTSQMTVSAGERVRIQPHSTDSRGYGAILVVGRVR